MAQALQQQLAERNGAPYIPGASGPRDYDEAMGYAASRLHDDYVSYSDYDDDNVVVVDPDNMYDDDGNIIDISKFEKVKEEDKPKGSPCKLGCDDDDDEEEEEESSGLLDGLRSALPSLPSLPSLSSFGGGDGDKGDGEEGSVGDFTPIIVVSVLGACLLTTKD